MLANKDARALLTKLLAKREGGEADLRGGLAGLFTLELGGGYSGSFVALIWLENLDTFILKAGPADEIEAETEARLRFASSALEHARTLRLAECSDPVEVEADGHDELWRAMAYAYVGSLSYEDIRNFTDFEAVFSDFVAPQREDDRPSVASLRTWLRKLCEEVRGPEEVTRPGVRAKPLSEYLPALPWRSGLTAVLEAAAAYAPDGAELRGLRGWWEETISRESLAPFPQQAFLHGDLRFANVLVNRTTATVELIDFGNAKAGHVFGDLARFECDLLFSVSPQPVETKTIRLSSEDRRMRALERAFSPDQVQLKDPDDPDNPVLAALQLIRESYGRAWHLTSDDGRRRMYLWFLFAEVLKRLTWIGDTAESPEIRQALLCAAVMLKRAVVGQPIGALGYGAVADLSRLLNCTGLYVPTHGYEATVNRQRNVAKAEALRRAAAQGSTVKLLAETGNSYLHFRGWFYPEIENLLETGRLRVVLANPSFVEAHGISAAYREPGNLDELGIRPLLTQKFSESMAGYSTLKGKFHDRIQVRIARHGIGATMLITDDVIFFEPYLRSDRRRRHQRLFETFEFRFSASNGHLPQLFSEHFAFHWTESDPLTGRENPGERYIPLLQQLIQMWETTDG